MEIVLDRNFYSPFDFSWPESWILDHKNEKNEWNAYLLKQKDYLMNRFFEYKLEYYANDELNKLGDEIVDWSEEREYDEGY